MAPDLLEEKSGVMAIVWQTTHEFMEQVIDCGTRLVLDDSHWANHPQTPCHEDSGDNRFREYLADSTLTGPGMYKWLHYAEPYHKHLAKFIGKSPVVVEVGVWSGGSLEMWKRIFGPGCCVHGVDYNPACSAYSGESTKVHIGNQADRQFWARFRSEVPHVDIFIDDGGHDPAEQMATMEEMLPHIAPGGVYICEDVHHSRNPFFGFVCSVMDLLHDLDPESCREPNLDEYRSEPTGFQSAIESFNIYPFLIAIVKRRYRLDMFRSPRRGTEWLPFIYGEERR